jgi:4-hydroxy-tetrahydrodipicolinate synthase
MIGLPNGVLPASVTPFLPDGSIDLAGVARLIAWFQSHGSDGIVLAGTNGECASLSAIEKRDLVKAVVPVAGEIPIVLGVATSSLEEAVWSLETARKAGAAAGLVMPPAFFREATEEGMALWFERLVARTELPVLLYNFPQRSGFAFSPDLVHRLCNLDGVAGLKDSSGNQANIESFAQAGRGKKLYLGDETLLAQGLEAGWSGAISGASNILAGWLSIIVRDWTVDQESSATKLAYIGPALAALRTKPQPQINKWLLRRLGVIDSADPRLPLVVLDDEVGEALWNQVKVFVSPT